MAERPGIYVHFEFGVAWTPRHHRNHQLTTNNGKPCTPNEHLARKAEAPMSAGDRLPLH
ncbi:hypothetical protein AUP68_16091 [Ilyonectria robusta]